MAAGAHVYEIFIRASRESVWEALTDPEHTVRYFHATRIESSFRPGEPWRFVGADDDRDAVEGVIETFDLPHRLVMTWRVLHAAAMSDEPPSRVEWTLTPADERAAADRPALRRQRARRCRTRRRTGRTR